MRSATSFFDLTLYRKTVNRFWPLWAVNLAFWLFLLPLSGMVALSLAASTGHNNAIASFVRGVGEYGTEGAVVFAIVAGLLVAMAVCSHMYNNRSANFIATLPIRREGQFISTYLAGLTILIGPNLLVFLLTLLVEAAAGMVLWVPLLFWLAALSAMEFFFYSFAVCLAQFAGHILAVPVYYGVFNVIFLAAYGLICEVLRTYYFGFANEMYDYTVAYWFTPAAVFWEIDIDVFFEYDVLVTRVEGLWVAAVYSVIGLVLAVCALLLYRRRHMETAGDIVAVKAMRPVFKYGVAACAGLALGILTTLMLGLGEVAMMISIIIWAVIGYFVAQMLLDKTIRVFKKWKGAVAVVGAFLLMFAVIAFDLTGYESRVPAANQVKEVTIGDITAYPWDSSSSLHGVVLTDPEDIEKVIALHETVVYYGENGEPQPDFDRFQYLNFYVHYTLKNGKILQRSYSVPAGDTMLALAQAIRDDYDVRYQSYGLDSVEEFKAKGGSIDMVSHYGDYINDYDYGNNIVEWHGFYAEKLWTAVMTDFEAGRIGVKSVYDEYSNNVHTLNFCWSIPMSKDEQDAGGVQHCYVEFAILDSATETLKVLDELMLKDNRYQDNPDDNPLWRSE